jgi:hypothetical protein
MAQANRDLTPSDPSKTKPPQRLSLEEVFQRWRVRLGSSETAASELYDLLCSRECRSLIKQVSADGEETCTALTAEFWRDTAHLVVEWDAANDIDHIVVRYPQYVHMDHSLTGGSTEFLVQAASVERWEGRYFPPPPLPPPADQPAPDPAPEDKVGLDLVEADDGLSAEPGLDPFRTGAAGRPTAMAVIYQEAERRIKDGEVDPQRHKRRDVAEDLAKWWAVERFKQKPLPGPSATAKTIYGYILPLWRKTPPKFPT